jgi:hypothetical protein
LVLDEFLVKLGVKDDLTPKLEKAGALIKGVGAAMGAFAVAAGAAAVKIGTSVVQQFGQLEQNLGGSIAVFGEYAQEVQKIGEDAYKNLGVSQSNYLATANKMGALFQGSGVEQRKSLDLTTQAMQRAADMASVMGIDMQVALDSVAGAAKGNFTMMDNLGVSMNAMTIEAYAAAKGLDFVWASASQAEKAEMAMQMFFDTTEQYAGNFAKESTQTISGSLGLLKAAVSSFMAGLGNAEADMTKLTGNLVDAFKAVVNNTIPILENIVRAIPQTTTAILNALGAILPSLLQTVTGLFSSVLQTILSMLPQLTPAAAEAIITIANALVDNTPLLIDAAIELIIAIATGLGQASPELVPAAINAVQTIIETIISRLPELIEAGMQMMGGLVTGLMNASPLIKAVALAIGVVTTAILAYKAANTAATVAQEIHNAVLVISAVRSGGLAAATGALAGVTGASTVATGLATAAQWLWNAAMMANPIGLIIAGCAALVVGIIALISWLNHQSEEEKRLQEQTKALVEENDALVESIAETGAAYDDRATDIEKDGRAAESLADKISALSAVENKSAEQKAQLAAYVDMLNEAMGESIVSYDEETDSMSRNIDEIYAMVEAQKQEAKAQAARERAVEIAKEQMDVEDQLNKIKRQREELDKSLAAGTIKQKFYNEEMQKLADTEAGLVTQQEDLSISFDNATKAVTEASESTEAANAIIASSTGEVVDAMAEANAKQEEIAAQRMATEQEVTDAMIRAANEQGLTLDEYKAKLEQTQEALDSYTEAATDMFNRLSEESEVSVSEMAANMEHNQQVLQNLGDNLASLEGKIDAGFLQSLRDAGPDAAGSVAAIASASEEELARLNAAFTNGSTAATDALMAQFGLEEVTNSGSDMVDDIAAGVEENTNLTDATTQLIQDAKTTADETVASVGFDTVGVAIADGVLSGFQSRKAYISSQIRSFFSTLVSEVKSDLDIHSPSGVFEDIGENMGDGAPIGFEKVMPEAGKKMEKSMLGAIDFAPSMAEKVAETLYSAVDGLSSIADGAAQDNTGGLKNFFGDVLSSISPFQSSGHENVFSEQLIAMGEKMGAFFDNASQVVAQMGVAANASYATSNNNVTYDNRTYDNKSNFNINDSSGQPEVTAAMVDRNQSLRIRNMRGVFA